MSHKWLTHSTQASHFWDNPCPKRDMPVGNHRREGRTNALSATAAPADNAFDYGINVIATVVTWVIFPSTSYVYSVATDPPRQRRLNLSRPRYDLTPLE